MDVYTYNPSTTALENIFRHGRTAFPLFRTPSWASMTSSRSSIHMTVTSTHKPSLVKDRRQSGEDDDDNNAFSSDDDDDSDSDIDKPERESEDEEGDFDYHHHSKNYHSRNYHSRKPSVPIAAATVRIPGPAPWTAGNNLLVELEAPSYPPPPRRTPRRPLPDIKLASRAQIGTHSELDSYLHFLTGHTLEVSGTQTTMTEPSAAAAAAAAQADAQNPMSSGLGEPPAVSFQTIVITGILCDIFGLDAMTPPSSTRSCSVLWLHNPRLGDRTRMHPMAKRIVHEYNRTKSPQSQRGLIAVAFDQRNHGVREVHPLANQSWKGGNVHHAQDMFGIVSGTVVDTRLLMDALPGYLFLNDHENRPDFDQHICLGVSLGGHSTWQTMFTDPRVTAGVSIIGCPDFQLLMKTRAGRSKLSTYDEETSGATFLGSKDFPPALVAQCAQFDPKGIVFGTGPVLEAPTTEAEQQPLRDVLDRHVKGKRMLMCTGGADKLVPWSCSRSFTNFFVNAAETWYKDSGLRVDNRIYKDIAHQCSDEMVRDAMKFVCEVVNEGPRRGEKVEARI